MASSIYTYALIKTLYDEGRDYVDSFWPFAVKVIPPRKSVDSSSIQKNLREKFDLTVPLHVIGVILARAERRNYIRQERDELTNSTKYRLTDAGLKYLFKLETDKEVERRINSLLESIKRFFEGKGIRLGSDQIRELLLYFVQRNIDFLIECINPSVSPRKITIPGSRGYDRYLLEYIESADKQEPHNYRMLENLVMGSIISVLLYVEKPEDITKIRTMKFSHCQVFLDANFVFSILGLDNEEFNEPAKELLNLLKRYDFDLKVFSFTLDEISRVLNSYHRECHRYPADINVNTLYSALNRKGWSKTDVREFIINLEQILRHEGIAIRWTRDINLSNYKSDDVLRGTIKKYKPGQNVFHQNHDLAAIAKISELRGKTIRRIEDSKAFFLTSDVRLSRFNLKEMGHKENGTICEVILDRLLTNILWLKNPNTKPPLRSIIAAYSRDLFVNRRVWDRFYEVLQELKREGKIKDDDIATLFWHSYVEDALRSIEETEADKITPQFVLKEIETVEKRREEDVEKRIKEIGKAKEEEMETILRKKEKEFAESLERSISEVESRREQEWLDKIRKIKENLGKHSEAKAAKWSIIYTILLTLAVVAIIAVAYLNVPFEILDLILTVFGGGGLIGLWKYGRSKIQSWLFERTYMQKLEEAKLSEIQ